MAGVLVYWDVCDREGVKIQDFYVSAGLQAVWLGSFSAPSWICREQAPGNAFLNCMALALGRVVFRCWKSTSRCVCFARYFAVMLKRIVVIILQSLLERCFQVSNIFKASIEPLSEDQRNRMKRRAWSMEPTFEVNK